MPAAVAGENGDGGLLPYLHLREIRAPLLQLKDQPLEHRGIWALPYALALRSSPHTVMEARPTDCNLKFEVVE